MTGITIVFIHGNFVTKRCWEPWVARYEARGHTCITIAWPGVTSRSPSSSAIPTIRFWVSSRSAK